MPALLTLLIVALASAGATALVIAVVLLRRQGRLDARRGFATAALAVVGVASAAFGITAVQPAPHPTPEPPAAVTVVDTAVDVQLPTLALDE